MPSSKLSPRGQIVVPLEVRRYLGVRAGDRVDFVIGADGEVTLRAALVDLRDLRGMLADEGQAPVSVEDMKEAVRSAHDHT